MRRIAGLTGCFIFLTTMAIAQKDSLVMKNGDILVGEIKNMTKGVMMLETVYSDKDFAVEWMNIREAYSNTRFLLLLTDGRRINGRFTTDKEKNLLMIQDEDGGNIFVPLSDLVYVKSIKSNFWGRTDFNVDAGFNMAKTNRLRQFTANIKFTFLGDAWQYDMYYNHLYAIQETVEPNRRIDGGLGFRYFLQDDWFLSASVTFLSNTEQALKLRSSGVAGGGKFLRRTNRVYWAVGAGIVFNNEVFYTSLPSKNSLEVQVGSELNLFDIGDLNLYVRPNLYKSITESGRWRFDFKADLKYDLPKDFYVKTNLTFNYDNQPAESGNTTDYIWAISFGWEF